MSGRSRPGRGPRPGAVRGALTRLLLSGTALAAAAAVLGAGHKW